MALPATSTTPMQAMPRKGLPDFLLAIDELLGPSDVNPTELFDQGLALLVEYLQVDQVFICRATDLGMEVFWWATRNGKAPDLALQELAHVLCPLVLEEAAGALLLQSRGGGTWRPPAPAPDPGTRTFLGVPLTRSERVAGVLSVLCLEPRSFGQGELAMVTAVAGLMGRTLEIEQLKYDLHHALETLDLTRAVMEDHALVAPATNLPSLHHLEVWVKPTMANARRTNEPMTLARWQMQGSTQVLQDCARELRGEDLLVDLGGNTFMLLLPRTDRQEAEPLLERLRGKLGGIPMGATVWRPGRDGHDPLLRQSQKRAQAALRRSQEGGAPLAWDLPGEGPSAPPEAQRSPSRTDGSESFRV